MTPIDPISKLTQQVLDALPETGVELKRQLHTKLLKGLRRLDLVTREEFEVQSQLLQRSREKLEMLEKKITEMERNGSK